MLKSHSIANSTLCPGGNDIFLMAQWFPRMVAYSDYEGWHNKEFLGRGEFTLEFGDYDVAITVPPGAGAGHVIVVDMGDFNEGGGDGGAQCCGCTE